MRGTVYVIVNGVPLHRRVLFIDIDQVEGWQHAARTRLVGSGLGVQPGSTIDFEFGPIGLPWR